MGSMLGSDEADKKPVPPAYSSARCALGVSNSTSLLPVLLAPSSSSSDAGGRGCFLCASQRLADDDDARTPPQRDAQDGARLLGRLLLDDDGRLVVFLSASHLSDEDARPGLLLMLSVVECWLVTDDAGLAGLVLQVSHLSTASARPGLGGGWIAFLHASHLSTASARLA
jgi:hypothetical protein